MLTCALNPPHTLSVARISTPALETATMPPMVICRKKLNVASDDFVLLYGCSVATRPIWLILIGLFLCFYERSIKCSDENILKGYLIVLEVLHIILFILELIIMIISSTGTIAKPRPRLCIPFLFCCQLFVFMVKLAWDITGVLWAFNPYLKCSEVHHLLIYMRGILVWNLSISIIHGFTFLTCIGLFPSLCCCFCFCGIRRPVPQDNLDADELIHNYHRKMWKRRLRYICCVLRGPYESEAYEEMSEVLAESFSYFRGYAVSDIVAGLVLCAMNSQKIQYTSSRTRKEIYLHKPGMKHYYDKVVRFAKFAVAAYGGTNCDNKGVFRLAACLSCISCSGSIPCSLHCRCGRDIATMIAGTAEISHNDIRYISPKTRMFCPAFYVACDHKRESVVVAITGMLSLKDVVTYLNVTPAVIENVPTKKKAGKAGIAYGHKGMMTAASAIHDSLTDTHVLTDAFKKYPNYTLIICGHSTGGGVAAILALMLKSSYKDLHCFAYAPPGCVLNSSAVRQSRDIITSVVFQNDIISRLTLESFDQLRTKIMSCLETSQLPKYKILLSSFYYWIRCCKFCIPGIAKRRSVTDILIDQEFSADNTFDAGQFQELMMDTRRLNPEDPITGNTRIPMSSPVTLYLPGKIIHITEKSRHWFKETQLQAHYTAQDEFSKIILERDMMSSHQPYRCLKIMLSLQKQKN